MLLFLFFYTALHWVLMLINTMSYLSNYFITGMQQTDLKNDKALSFIEDIYIVLEVLRQT